MNIFKKIIRKAKIFFMDFGVIIAIAIFLIVLIALTIWGLSVMESFYRKMAIAQFPMQLLMGAFHAAIFITGYTFFLRGGFGNLSKKRIKAQHIKVKFSDVIGVDEAKEEAMEVVDLITDHKRVRNIGGKIIKGILFLGPPGTGKTLLAKAIASESKTPFLSISGSEFVEVFVGVGASRVRKLFKQARRLAYSEGSCIVFIDELDVIGRSRQYSFMGGSETNSTQNQLLVEMDGLQKKSENIIVIGATNASEDSLDTALLRPGRFDRKIYISRPYAEGRTKLFEFYLGKVKYDPSINCDRLGKKTMHRSPADIENIVKEAALIATREGRDIVSYKDISSAMERIDLGVKRKRKINPAELNRTAHHEVGHLLAVYFLHPVDRVFKVSIATRNDSLGVVHHQPTEELMFLSKDMYLADIQTSLAGYIAEKIAFGFTASGVASDFKQAMYRAHEMVWKYGMGDSGYVGDYTIIDADEISENVKHRLNDDTEKILKECREKVENLLKTEAEIFNRFVKELLEKEEMDYDDIEAIFTEYGKSKVDVLSADMKAHTTEISLDEMIKKSTEPGKNNS